VSTAIIVAPLDDAHALAVQEQVRRIYGDAKRCLIFDPATFPISSTAQWELGIAGSNVFIDIAPPLAASLGPRTPSLLAARGSGGCVRVPLDEISGVWWRRSRGVVVHPSVVAPELREFCEWVARECLHAFFEACPVHNPIWKEEAACGKPYQLLVASHVGLRIPETLITTNPEDVKAFSRRLRKLGRQVVYKHSADATGVGVPTRRLGAADLDRLELARLAATTFQEYITGIDYRIVVIAGRVFAAEWRPEHSEEIVDIRMDPGARMRRAECPAGLDVALLEFQERLGLSFGVYDIRVTSEGEPVFLEVNPSGQWLDVELEARHPISEAWARLLVEGPSGTATTHHTPLTYDDLDRLQEAHLEPPLPAEWNRII
jgi:hypothetical protein